MARILIITPKQPSGNPRMRKSADALANAGHTVHVLYAHNAAWSDEADKPILKAAKWTFERVGGHPVDSKGHFFISRLERKTKEILGQTEKALCRSYGAYIRKAIQWRPDMVIGHNPGALAPCVQIGEELNIPRIFDAEDFHRAESYWVRVGQEQKIIDLENQYLPRVSQMTSAAPLISEAYKKLYPDVPVTTVNNAFNSSLSQTKPAAIEGPLRIIWFSQNLGLDRGLQEFLAGMALVPEIPIQLNLLGKATHDQKHILEDLLESPRHHIDFHAPRSEQQLFKFIGKHEIGLALEKPIAYNREICRTNKLYTYPLTGCYMFASSTKSQNQFMEEYPQTGKIVHLDDPQSIANALTDAYENREELLNCRKAAWELGQGVLNWGTESDQLLNAVNQTLG